MTPDDDRDLAITAAIDQLATRIARANNLPRKDVLERFVAFAENDEDAPVTPVAPIKLKKRKRTQQAEAHP
jgi:hypothetical protein